MSKMEKSENDKLHTDTNRHSNCLLSEGEVKDFIEDYMKKGILEKRIRRFSRVNNVASKQSPESKN